MRPLDFFEGCENPYKKQAESGPLRNGESWWRAFVDRLLWANGGHPNIVKPEILTILHTLDDDVRQKASMLLEPDDLAEPWTPLLLLYASRMQRVAEQAEHGHYASTGELPWWYQHDDNTNLTLPAGERLYTNIIRVFKEAGLDKHAQYKAHTWWEVRDGATETEPVDWVANMERRRDDWRRITQWLASNMRWVSFQMDSNGLGFHPNIDGPHVWQRIVDVARKQRPKDWVSFLQNMKMADVGYAMQHIPGALGDPLAMTKDPANPLGYGVSATIPSFGYRREHRTNILLASWATSVGLDLFNEEVWCTHRTNLETT